MELREYFIHGNSPTGQRRLRVGNSAPRKDARYGRIVGHIRRNQLLLRANVSDNLCACGERFGALYRILRIHRAAIIPL